MLILHIAKIREYKENNRTARQQAIDKQQYFVHMYKNCISWTHNRIEFDALSV